MSTQELSVFEESTSLEVYDPKTVDNIIEAAKAGAESFVGDVSTAKGRKDIASFAYKFSTSKTHLVKLGKRAIAVEEEKVKKWKAGLKRVSEAFDECRDKVKQPVLDWERKEEGRIARHQHALKMITIRKENHDLDEEELQANIDWLEALQVGESWEEFEHEAKRERDEALESLKSRLVEVQEQARKDAELKRLKEAEEKRKAEEEAANRLRDRIEQIRNQEANAFTLTVEQIDERIKQAESLYKGFDFGKFAEVADRVFEEVHAGLNAVRREQSNREQEKAELQKLREAEAKRLTEEQEAEREAQRKADQAKAIKEAEEAAAKAERERLAKIEAEKKAKADAEAKAETKRKADLKYRNQVRQEAAEGLRVWGMESSEAASLILAIDKGEVAHVSINY